MGNEASRRRLARNDAFVAYVMDRLLYRLGRSSQADEFYLKGGVLVANLVAEPHRFTRDVDFLRRHGPPDPDDIRPRFERILAVAVRIVVQLPRGRRATQNRPQHHRGTSDSFPAVSVRWIGGGGCIRVFRVHDPVVTPRYLQGARSTRGAAASPLRF